MLHEILAKACTKASLELCPFWIFCPTVMFGRVWDVCVRVGNHGCIHSRVKVNAHCLLNSKQNSDTEHSENENASSLARKWKLKDN